MRIIISSLVIVFSLHSCKEIPITPLNITKSLTLIGEKQVTNNSFGYSITKDSLLIMIAYGDADEKFIHVYDTAFNFKFSVGDKGKLFSEFNMPQFFNTNFIDSTFVGKSIDMNYGSFFIYNSTRKKKIIVA